MTRRVALLNAAAWCIGVVGLALAGWLVRPLPPWSPPVPPTTQRAHPSPLPASDPVEAVRLAELCRRPLQQPLFDAPPPPEAPPPPRARPEFQLLATALNGAEAFAILRRADASTVLVSEGQAIPPFTVTKIERGQVQLQNGADTFTLQVPWYSEIAEARP